VDDRPIAVVGAGTLGRRIAAMLAAGGADVRIFDLSAEQRAAAVAYATEQAPGIRQKLGLTAPHAGAVKAAADLPGSVDRAWLVIEAVPEKRNLKIEVFGTLDRLAADAMASNSSSLATSELADKVHHVERVLNTHYQMPPDLNTVELMSDSSTDENIIPALMAKLPRYGFVPFHVRRQKRRLHPQPHLGRHQAGVPDGRRRGCGAARGRGPHVEALRLRRGAAVPADGPGRPRRGAGHRGALRGRAPGHSGRPRGPCFASTSRRAPDGVHLLTLLEC
jgi:hypothetical protein